MSEPIDMSHLPKQIVPNAMDAVHFTKSLVATMLALADAKGLFTRKEFGDLLASMLDPTSGKPSDQLLIAFAHTMQIADEAIADHMASKRPSLRVVDSDGAE